MPPEPVTPRVMIASPTPGEVKTVYSKTAMMNMNDLAQHGIHAHYETEDGSHIAIQRNKLATRFLASDCTHLFFLDADMMSDGTLCRTLLIKQKPFIGAVCSGKSIDFARIETAIKGGIPLKQAVMFGFQWLFYPVPGREHVRVDNGIAEVSQIGSAALLIERSVLTTMIAKGVATKRTTSDLDGNHAVYNFFGERAQEVSNNETVGEDIAFCRRWRDGCGGEIWALADVVIFHIGNFAYGGNFFDYLTAQAAMEKR